ncbi:MAG: hypothetical protein ACI8XV_000376, partial [Arenicella sp.]
MKLKYKREEVGLFGKGYLSALTSIHLAPSDF